MECLLAATYQLENVQGTLCGRASVAAGSGFPAADCPSAFKRLLRMQYSVSSLVPSSDALVTSSVLAPNSKARSH